MMAAPRMTRPSRRLLGCPCAGFPMVARSAGNRTDRTQLLNISLKYRDIWGYFTLPPPNPCVLPASSIGKAPGRTARRAYPCGADLPRTYALTIQTRQHWVLNILVSDFYMQSTFQFFQEEAAKCQ